jgi:hypothetical protein
LKQQITLLTTNDVHPFMKESNRGVCTFFFYSGQL